MTTPVPANEKQRLRELYGYDILDTEPAEGFTKICELASLLLDVPIALVNFVDQRRVWIKARVGLETGEVGRDTAFCSHTIMSDEPLIVNDLSIDPTFRDNPLVTDAGGIRFYAGVPLTPRAGLRVGTFCVLDTKARELSERQLAALDALGALALEQLKLHRFKNASRGEIKRRMLSERTLRQRSEQLARSETLLAQTTRIAKIGGWEYDIAADRLVLSDQAAAIHDLVSGEMQSPVRDCLRRYVEPGRATLLSLVRRAIETGEPFELELALAAGRGITTWVRVIGEAEFGEHGPTRLFGVIKDVTERKRSDDKLAHLARHDALTGLRKREPFEEQLAREMLQARRTGSGLAVLLLDIDRLREVNDTLGHGAGDALIRGVAEKLRRAVPNPDLLARFGGDEFGVLLTGLSGADEGARLASALLDVFREPVGLAQEDLYVTVSAGLSFFPAYDEEPAQVLKNADIARSRAKALGGARCHVFEPALKEAVENRRRVLREVRDAIGRDEFTIHYQPIIGLRDDRINGFEALLRWHHPARGIVAPGAFLPALEDAALSTMLGDGVLRRVFADARRWLDEGLEFGRLGINVAAGQFRSRDLGERIEECLDAYGVSASLLMIEVTETVLMERAAENVDRALRHLQGIGAQIVFDDFGTGYASLTHLKRFPVDRLKIDQSFVRDITRDPDDAAIVRAVVNLGQSLGMGTVAEGVETVEQLDFVALCGCDAAQGYLFSRPMPAGEVPPFLAGWSSAAAAEVRKAG